MIRFLCSVLILSLFVPVVNGQEPEPDFTQVYRPQFHFTSAKNWIGNPAAAVFIDSVYHLFFEYSPIGNTPVYSNMGHAVSRDLLHWEIKPVALEPDDDTRDLYRCSVRCGSALLDEQNLLREQHGISPTLVVFYTSRECGVRMAYSNDKGETWVKSEKNPLIPYDKVENARDPKVFWYEPGKNFVMILARDPKDDDVGEGFSFYTSTNLFDWTYRSHIVGPKGRPDLFQLSVDSHPEEMQWVLTDSVGEYMIGDFDGKSFTALTGLMKSDYGTYNGAVTWKVPGSDGTERVIQIGSIGDKEISGMPFAGQMSFPAELRLRKYTEGLRLVKEPVKELELLQEKAYSIHNENVLPGLDKNPVKRIKGDCFRLKGTFDIKTVNSFGYMIRARRGSDGTEIRYDAVRNVLSCMGQSAVLTPEDGKVKLDVLVDRSSLEVYGNDGKAVISTQFTPNVAGDEFILYNTGGELLIEQLDVFPLQSTYPKKK